jgi:hypothetical protein
MHKPLVELEFDELVDEASRQALSQLLTKGGEGLKSAMWTYMSTAIQWSKERQAKEKPCKKS